MATFMSSVVCIAVQQAACNIISMFSNRIIVTINQNLPQDKKVPANLGTVLIGIVAGVGALFAPKMLKTFGRRQLMMGGHLIMSGVLGMLAVTIVMEMGYMSYEY